MKKLLTVVVVLLLCGMSMGQSISLMPLGVSPAQVKADTVGNENYVGVFDRTFSGLLNVGVETQMYLKGMGDSTLVAPTWAVTSAPDGSAAGIGTVVDVDSATQIALFTPDVVGTYVVEFGSGADVVTATVNAGTYLGIEGGNCALCHKAQADEWAMTGHAVHLTDALNGEDRSGDRCLPCHSTGFDADAANNGFDDFDFEYPANPHAGVADSLAAVYPDAMARANIQCEACHGPGSAHMGNVADNKMVSSLATAACAVCHDDDHYHVYPSQWNAAGHSNIPSYPGGGRTTCKGCHNGAQFIQFVEGETITTQSHVDITCAVCHDPHSAENEEQLRTMTATLANGMEVTDAGRGAICMNCHQNRRESVTYATGPKGHFGPHYAPQADMLIGTNAITFGKELPQSAHFAALENACVDCHMYEIGSHGEHDAEGNLNTSGMHSFAMVNKDGVDNVAACADCHGDIGESFADKKFFMNGDADLDGDGDVEGLQDEVHGLMDALGAMLPDADPHANLDSTWTLTEIKAAFNHRLVYYDHSYGIHNPAFTVALLKVTMEALENNALDGEIVAIQDVPNDQGKQVRIIWDSFVDDGAAAVDPVQSYTVKRMDGDVWVGVGEHTADGSNRYALVVPTIYDSTATMSGMTAFKVVAVAQSGMVHESVMAEGYSVDNLVPMAPAALAAVVDGEGIKLSWEEAVDEDFNYFAVYKSTEEGFVPSEDNLLAKVASTEFTDADIVIDQKYYYAVSAFDFSGNESEHSNTELMISAVDGNAGNIPTEFTLRQNYPNPFNPSTTVEFGLPEAHDVTVNVFDIRGSLVNTIAQGMFTAGYHKVTWNGYNASGLPVAAGTYMYELRWDNQTVVKKMLYLK